MPIAMVGMQSADRGTDSMQENVARAHRTAIGVVVVNYGSANLLEENLRPLADDDNSRVIVVDNFSTVEERARVTELGGRLGWSVVLLETNTGFAGGVNAGLARARRLGLDAYLLLNPDAAISPATVRALHDHVRAKPLELVAPKITKPNGEDWSLGFAVDLRTGRMRRRPGLRDLAPDEAPWLTGTCLAISERLLELISEVPDDYFLYWEDVDLSMLVRRAGGTLRVREDLTAIHDEGGTQRTQATGPTLSKRYYFYNCRNRLVFAARHLDRRRLLAWILATPRQSWLILLRGGRRQLLHSPGSLAAAVSGSLIGLGHAVRAMVRPVNPYDVTRQVAVDTPR